MKPFTFKFILKLTPDEKLNLLSFKNLATNSLTISKTALAVKFYYF